jgi:uncharacterized repeat protein (TIGR03803 family)
MTPSGTVTILHTFLDRTVLNDGSQPTSALVLGRDGNLYGTTAMGGGAANVGCVFEMTTTGKFLILHGFQDGSVPNDGSTPLTSLTQGSDGNLYGMTQAGGANFGGGTAFVISPTQMFVTSPSSVTAPISQPFTYQVVATHGPTGFSATNLPAGLSIDANTGIISGTPTTVQSKVAVITLTNAFGSENFNLSFTINAPAPAITSLLTAYGSAGTTFNYTTTATNLPTSFAASGLTGSGLSIDTSTGLISGTNPVAGTYTVSLSAANATGTGPASTLVINILASAPTLAQEYSVLHRFGDGSVTNDGTLPFSIIQATDGNFYGAAGAGGANNNSGAIFKMTPQGVVSTFYSFNGNVGMAFPQSLIQAANGDFIGTTSNQIFRLTQTGTLTLLHIFLGISQLQPLVQGTDGNFYSVVETGGTFVHGFAYKMSPSGQVTILHNFGDPSVTSDGIAPHAALIQGTDGNFYGTTANGGSASFGTIFKMTPAGVITILHSFGDHSTANDGTEPQSPLCQGSDGNFYGTTLDGTNNTNGTIFKMTPSGTVTTLYGNGSQANDSISSAGGLIQGLDGNFYGTTLNTSTSVYGTAFQITPQGVMTVMHSFNDPNFSIDGRAPRTLLVQTPSGNFYGVSSQGGTSSGYGTVYTITAKQTPSQVPIFTGPTTQVGALNSAFVFTPKALFATTGAGITGQSVTPPSSGGLLGYFLPQTIHTNGASSNWTLTGTLPNYLTFDPIYGTISGSPAQSGTFTVTLKPSNFAGAGTAKTVTLIINPTPGVTSPATATGTVNTPFIYQIASTPAATEYGASNLPSWLSVDSTTGIISGTPPAAGTYAFNAVASNIAGPTSQLVTLTVTGGSSGVPTITSAATASTAINATFNYQITTAHAATSYNAFSLPDGLVFDATSGAIFGMPIAAGTYQIPITATNASGSAASVLTLTITQPLPPGIAPTLSATAVQNAAFTYQIPVTGTVTSYAETGTLPSNVTFDTTTGIFSGTPTATGTFTINLTVSNAQGSSQSVLTLNVVAAQTFGEWQTAYHPSGGPAGIPLNDGIPNFLKYFYHIDPTQPATPADHSALPTTGSTTVNSTPYLTLTYREYQRQTGLAVAVQASTDLVHWTTDTTPTDQPLPTGFTDPTTGDPYMQARVPITSPHQFIRVKVSLP